MELSHLRYFQVAAARQHISRAAEDLNISQPALSTMISRLEQELGVPLFDRSGRTVTLNAFGRTFLKRTNDILLSIENVKRELQEMQNASEKAISLAVTSPQFLQGMEDFVPHHPDYKWNLQVNELAEIKSKLERGQIDLAITSPGIMEDDFETCLLLRDEFKVAVHPDHPLAAKDSVSLQDIAQEKFIALLKGMPFRTQTDLLFSDLGITPNIIMECDHYLRRELINTNVGITIASSSAQFRHLYNEKIRFLPIEDARRTRDIVMTYKKGRYLPEATRNFCDFIRAHYRQYG